MTIHGWKSRFSGPYYWVWVWREVSNIGTDGLYTGADDVGNGTDSTYTDTNDTGTGT